MAAAAAAATHEPEQQQHGHRNGTATTPASTIASNRWGPYSGAGDFASNMAVILAALLAALALALALHAAARYLLRRCRPRPVEDPEKQSPPAAAEAPAPLVYSAAGTKLVGAAAAECAICLGEFVDGDAVRVMPACGHGFHARCIERWLAGGRRSSCPTCRAPAASTLLQPRGADAGETVPS
ncbi:RING-H2 finger protein ATL79 [Brachypodium distachyon]|uniref:RING-type domain-containing protein n=1 Tax=Brachypodium distachyon TaxID=15368 RepID=I1GQM0_BRADI|nr:RING-H2 finger protein ATL79 [Brachypodium distachyon]KQK14351.1 hypothetical protein BRADI_1g15627v3 [Brachypodium distachyon]|eukprot:XP_003559716.2 RING-H2 finger protein ATL79 [Brachypodium distachyon]